MTRHPLPYEAGASRSFANVSDLIHVAGKGVALETATLSYLYFYKLVLATKVEIASHSNTSEEAKRLPVEVVIGSEVDFENSFGLPVDGGAEIAFRTEGEAPVEGVLQLAQALGAQSTRNLEIEVPARSRLSICTARLTVDYWAALGVNQHGAWTLSPSARHLRRDVIQTGVIAAAQSKIESLARLQ